MSSGVHWVETYLDSRSDRRRLLALQAHEQPGAVIEYLRTLPRAAEPGTHFNYNTAETFLLGAILAGAIHRPLSDYLSDKIWRPCGMESSAYWQLEAAGGQEFAGSGLSACLRDYARFGAFVLADGVVDGVRLLPEGWIAESTAVDPASIHAPGKLVGFEPLGYGHQWWTFPVPSRAPRVRGFGHLRPADLHRRGRTTRDRAAQRLARADASFEPPRELRLLRRGDARAARRMMADKPYSAASERNREPILAVLREHCAAVRSVLEIGTGTGQHAVYFAQALPHLTWQCSDRSENLPGIRTWLAEAALPNTPAPIELDVNGVWPSARFDAVYSANTLHIMGWSEVQRFFSMLPSVLSPAALLTVYGPFNRDGRFTSESNARFDAELRRADPKRGIRDFEAVDALARAAGLSLLDDRAMPSNNACITWRRPSAD